MTKLQLVALLLAFAVLAVQCHEKASSHEEEGGEEHDEHHYGGDEHKGEKGHHSDHSFKKGEKGSHGKEEDSHHYNEVRYEEFFIYRKPVYVFRTRESQHTQRPVLLPYIFKQINNLIRNLVGK